MARDGGGQAQVRGERGHRGTFLWEGFKIPKVNWIVLPVAQLSMRWEDKRVQSNSDKVQSSFRGQLTTCLMCFQSVTGTRLTFFFGQFRHVATTCPGMEASLYLCQVRFSNQSAIYQKEHVFWISPVTSVRLTCLNAAHSDACALVEMLE